MGIREGLDVLRGACDLKAVIGGHNGRHHAQVRCKVKLIRTDYSHVTRDVVTEQHFVSVPFVQPQGTREGIRQVILTANESVVFTVVCPLPHLRGADVLRIAPAFLEGAGDRTGGRRRIGLEDISCFGVLGLWKKNHIDHGRTPLILWFEHGVIIGHFELLCKCSYQSKCPMCSSRKPDPHAFREGSGDFVFAEDRVNRPVFLFVDDDGSTLHYILIELGDHGGLSGALRGIQGNDTRVVTIDEGGQCPFGHHVGRTCVQQLAYLCIHLQYSVLWRLEGYHGHPLALMV
nr:MAG TPA: hypothetical protein [Caudoviricetes sp.]